MWEKVKNTAVIVLATLGVLFIILMILPDDGEDFPENDVGTVDAQESSAGADSRADGQEENATENVTEKEEQSGVEKNSDEEVKGARQEEEGGKKEDKDTGNTVEVSIPSSEISDDRIRFTAVSLDNKEVTQEIFSDYDLTVVHVWGTFCQPCIEEMEDYVELYKELPDNVNLIAIISDVYDGIDSNVPDADSILKDAGAKFVNLRTSDDLYDITENLQNVPASFFVDGSGHIIGSMMEGAGFDETKSRLDSYLR